MNRPFVRLLALGIALSGCAGGTSGIPAQSPGTTALRPDAHLYGNDWMYSSRPSGNQIAVYKRDQNGVKLKFDEALTSGLSAPMGLVSTPAGRLYVANSGDSNVLVYRSTHRGPQGPVATLSDGGQVPVNVAVRPDRHVVAVSNASTTGNGAGSVSVYLHGATAPSRTLTYGKDPIQGEGVALDSSGNCFWSFNDPVTLTGSVVEFANCKGTGTPIVTGLFKSGGLAFDRSQNLYYVDQLAGLFKCTGTSDCSLLAGIGCTGCLLAPADINFDDQTPQNLWVADAAGYLDAVSLSGLIEYTLELLGGPSDPPIGIAPAPGT
jgi:hypothetical protein